MAKDAYKSRKFLWWNLEPYMKIAAKVLVSACRTKYTPIFSNNPINEHVANETSIVHAMVAGRNGRMKRAYDGLSAVGA